MSPSPVKDHQRLIKDNSIVYIKDSGTYGRVITITGGPRYSTDVRVQRLHRAAYPNRVISGVSNLT